MKDALASQKIGVTVQLDAPPCRANMKVIAAGWGRTGTSSFKKAMEILYGGKCYHMVENHKNNDFDFWLRCSEAGAKEEAFPDFDEVFGREKSPYIASCDWPSSAYWKQQLKQYPDAKVVLTYRDAESWYKSCIDTIFRMNPKSPHSNPGIRSFMFVMGGRRPLVSQRVIFEDSLHSSWNKDSIIARYNAHVQDVKDSCPGILVFEAKDGWAPLCAYLDMPVPQVPYPRVNDTEEFQGMITRTSIAGYILGTVLLGLPFLLSAGPDEPSTEEMGNKATLN
jgi:Sulfotransferase domain